MPLVILAIGHYKSYEKHIWTGGESSDFLLVKVMHRKGNYMLWISSVSCCSFFSSWILFPINTISWRISGLLLLTRLVYFLVFLSRSYSARAWTAPYVHRCYVFVKITQCSKIPRISLQIKGKKACLFLKIDVGFSSHVTGFCPMTGPKIRFPQRPLNLIYLKNIYFFEFIRYIYFIKSK